MYVQTFTYGKVPIEIWEWPVLIFLIIAFTFGAAYTQRRHITDNPEYRYYLLGLLAKIVGGLAFACIYVFYYKQGDTTSFYECSMAFSKLFHHDLSDFFAAYTGPGTPEIKSYFTMDTGEPMMYMLQEGSTRFTMKILVPFMLISGNSYFITTLLVSVFTYGALWQLFRMFVSYFPRYTNQIAIAILFMPSVLFWGSGILKDSFTLAATCYLMVCTYRIISKKGSMLLNVAGFIFFAWAILSIKAYVLLILIPSTLVWFFYSRIKRIKNQLIRTAAIPFIYLMVFAGSYIFFSRFGESFGKFSLDRALQTAAITQNDLKQEYYQGNSFDIGEWEPTIGGALSKFPQATIAGLYRPFIFESKNVVMLISGLENLMMLGLTLFVLIRIKWKTMFAIINNYPIILYSLVFSILFAFMIGLTTSNFGAMVRFKIPLIPLYMGSIMVFYGSVREVMLRKKGITVR